MNHKGTPRRLWSSSKIS